MEIRLDSERVTIETRGPELVVLKTKLRACIGDALEVSTDKLVFPRSCEDIVAENIKELSEALAGVESSFSLHASARERSGRAFENGDVSLIPEFWRKILDFPQQRAVNRMVFPNLLGLCLFDEQGSGKTVMSIAAFDILKERDFADAAFVVCPTSMLAGWKSDFEKFLPKKYGVREIIGAHKRRRELVLQGGDVLIMNYESLSSMKIPLGIFFGKRRVLLIVDESYYAKNADAIRSRAAMAVRERSVRCFVLCGTPAPNSPYDLQNQFTLADKGFTFSAFARTGNIENDKEKILRLVETRGTFIRRLKEEILEGVPEKKFQVLSATLSGRQRILYEEARRKLALELRSFDARTFRRNLTSYFSRRSVLLQICSVPSAVDPAFSEVPAKYVVLDELLKKLFSEKRKVILWSVFVSSIEELRVRYSDWSPLVIDGSVAVADRERAVKEFQDNPEKLLFIANPSAAGAGITLHAAHDAVYVSYTNQVAHILQSFDRIHRRGQKSSEVNYYLLVCAGTIEENEVLRLRERERQQQELLGDSVPYPSSLDEALSELGESVIS